MKIYKNIFGTFILILLGLILFFMLDFIVSKYTNLFHIRKNCYEYFEIKKDNKNFYSYDLSKNCFAFEHKGKTPAYNVYTNNQGYRVGKNSKQTNKDKIIFLGDSFTYGFGVDYEHSVPGYIQKKLKNKFEIINLAVTGYSPSMNLFKLNEYLTNSNKSKIKKVFYILDLTDVHDESNRWTNLEDIARPVLQEKNVENEIEKTFNLKEKFRASRFLSYLVNKNIRNLRKQIRKLFYEHSNDIEPGTYWAKFTHTPKKELYQDKKYKELWKNNEKFGLKKINEKIFSISRLLYEANKEIEFYIVIHPWRETLELGQKEFSWEDFAENLCFQVKCKKLINFFDDVRNLRKNNINWKKEIYFRLDLHHTKYGNKLYSDRILKDAFN